MASLNSQLDINALVEMGFTKERVEHAIKQIKNPDIQSVVEWLFSHPVLDDSSGHKLGDGSSDVKEENNDTSGAATNENDNAQASPDVEGDDAMNAQALSLKCEDCGKQLRGEVDVQAHASRTGHTNFVESTEPIKPLTQEEKEEKKRKLQEKMEERRKERERTEKEQEKTREMTRRKTGHEVTQAREEQAYKEMKLLAEERRKAKLEEKLLKQKLRAEIANDRAQFKQNSNPKDNVKETKAVNEACAAVASKPDYDTARIQFRLPDGSTHKSNFDAKDTLQVLYDFISKEVNQEIFELSMTFPRKTFTTGDMSKTLKDLGLVPSAALVVKK